MSWNTGQWNSDSITPEAWAAYQQQNWQWAQWQQQYAQWQSQYGEKYSSQTQTQAQHMHAFQPINTMPPLPTGSAPLPAPPPPDKPPPPPPHENNQPLFGNNHKPAPVPPPTNAQHTNTNVSGNTQNRAGTATAGSHNSQSASSQAAVVNADALKKLAEEQKAFDIQFQKWEEEIEKWKKDNVNHPDKQAYREYEQKFEACRAQLMVRQQQMKEKRASLLGYAPQTPNLFGNALQTPGLLGNALQTPGLLGNALQTPGLFGNALQTPGLLGNPLLSPGLLGNGPQAVNFTPVVGNNKAPTKKPTFQNTNITSYNQNNSQQSSFNNNHSLMDTNLSVSKQNNQQYGQYQENNSYQSGNKNTDSQFESYQHMDKYSSSEEKSSFLSASGSGKVIPGLDLVPESAKLPAPVNHEIIDITEEQIGNVRQTQGPDLTNISKGINNILGDEKIMNMLRNVQSTNVPNNILNANMLSLPPCHIPPPAPAQRNQINHNNTNNFQLLSSNNQWDDRNENSSNNQYVNRQNTPFNRQGPGPYPVQQQIPTNRTYNGRQQDMHQEQFYDTNNQFGESNMAPRGGPSNIRPNMPTGRPLLQDMSSHQNMNDYHRSPYESRSMHEDNVVTQPTQPSRPKWVEEPLFTPSIIVDYEHKPLRLKARDFLEPVHMFDYNHVSKDAEFKKKDFEKEADDLFTRKSRRLDDDLSFFERTDRDERFSKEPPSRDYERRMPRVETRAWRDEPRDDHCGRITPRDDYDDRGRYDARYEERRRDDRDKYVRREDIYRDRERSRDFARDRDLGRERDSARDRDLGRDRDSARDRDLGRDKDFGRDRDTGRDRYRDSKRDDSRNRSKSRERDSRKRERSREIEPKENAKKAITDYPKHIIMVDDILEPPGRDMRPKKIVIILRGPPGSGKSYLAKLIRDREAEYGGTVRIMSIDDYFMQDTEVEEKDTATGKIIKIPQLKYEYDPHSEETYIISLKRAFKRSLTDGYFSFVIYDAVNEQLKCYADIWNFSRQQGFQVYVCTTELDPYVCHKRNIHNRSFEEIQQIVNRFFPTPVHHIQLDPTTLLQSAAITDVQMEDAIVDDVITVEDATDTEVENVFTSKWEKMDNAAQLARLDGISKPLRPSQLSMEDYLQLDDWKPNTAKPGKKTVRWADIEERRQQEKMRAIGFVVGQTDWDRMTDPTMGSSALTQTKYIERVRRN